MKGLLTVKLINEWLGNDEPIIEEELNDDWTIICVIDGNKVIRYLGHLKRIIY